MLIVYSPFLADVTSAATFDTQLQQYITGDYAQLHFQQLIGCSAYDASNTTNYYARYTTSVLCNAIVQNSITPCGLTGTAARPLCADACVSKPICTQINDHHGNTLAV